MKKIFILLTTTILVFLVSTSFFSDVRAQCIPNPTNETELATCMNSSPGNIILGGSFTITTPISLANNTIYVINLNGQNVTWAIPSAFTDGNGSTQIELVSGGNSVIFLNTSNPNEPTISLTLNPSGSFAGALPIELSAFNVKPFDGGVDMNWQTTTETNNEKFIIERSSNGREFSTIGEVAGAGTSLEQHDYEFIDRQPMPGKNYYRLKQMDFDGRSATSPVRLVEFKSDSNVRVFPTMSNHQFTVRSEEGTLSTIRIFDLQGRLLREVDALDATEFSFDLDNNVAGNYLVVVNAGGNISHHQITKK